LRLGNAKTGGSRELPKTMLDPASLLDRAAKRWDRSREPPVSHAFLPKHAIEQMMSGMGARVKAAPLQTPDAPFLATGSWFLIYR